jgi:hypothetical protein
MYIAMDIGECFPFAFFKMLLMKFSRRVWARKPTEDELKRQEITRALAIKLSSEDQRQ